jgi:hypothetical protein
MGRKLCSLVLTSCLIFLVAVSTASAAKSGPPKWRRLAKGLEYLVWKVDMCDTLTGQGFCREGKPIVHVLRIDPNLFSFGVYHYSMYGQDAQPMKIEEWRSRLDAAAAFNAGEYYPDFSYMGLLVNSHWLFSTKQHPDWQGIFEAEPHDEDSARARIVDLKYDSFDLRRTTYSQIAQSMMLFDATGAKRIKRSDWSGNRTALAEDEKGRILVFVTEGDYTLWDVAQMLQESPFNLVQAMALDGGYRSALSISYGGVNFSMHGQWETSDYGDVSLPGLKIGLPAVIAVFPRE